MDNDETQVMEPGGQSPLPLEAPAVLTKKNRKGRKEGAEEEEATDDEIVQPVDLHEDHAAYLMGECKPDEASEYASSSVASPSSKRPEFLSPEPPKSVEPLAACAAVPIQPTQKATKERPKIRPTKAPAKKPNVENPHEAADIPVLFRVPEGGYDWPGNSAECSVSESSHDEKPVKKAG